MDTPIVPPTVPTQNETEDAKYDSLVVERYLIELGQLNGFETRTEYIRLSPSTGLENIVASRYLDLDI